MDDNVIARLAGVLPDVLEPLELAANHEGAREELLRALGWEVDELSGFPVESFVTDVGAVADGAIALATAARRPVDSLSDVADLLRDIGAVFAGLESLSQVADRLSSAAPSEAKTRLGSLGEELLHYLIVEYLWRHRPVALTVGRLLSLIRTANDDTNAGPLIRSSTGQSIVRYPVAPPRVRLDRLSDLIRNPGRTLRREFLGVEGIPDTDAARAVAGRLYGRLGTLLAILGAEVSSGNDLPEASVRDPSRTLAFQFSVPVDAVDVNVGAILELVSDAEGGGSLVVTPIGWADMTWESRHWTGRLRTSGVPLRLRLGGTAAVVEDAGLVELRGEASRLSSPDAPASIVGGARSSRLEVGSLRLWTTVRVNDGVYDVEVGLEAESAALVLAPGDSDGFLRQALPEDGLRMDFELGGSWSKRTGLRLKGASGLDATIPLHRELGPIELEAAHLRIAAVSEGLDASIAATAILRLGPIRASVERVGLRAITSFPEHGGNVGAAHVTLGFQSPTGAGLVINAGPVSGGGFISYDEEAAEYAGAVQLRFSQIELKAIGLLTTRLPGGAPGFSLLVIISGEFPPLQLGLGFTLNGVGGLIGINRTVDAEVLRAGIRTRTLDSVLFPRTERSPAQIIGDLRSVFPAADGRYVFGPAAKIGWGSPTPLMTADIGLVLELPAPVRLLILGRLRLVLPSEKAAVALINMDVRGVIEFAKGQISVDATLYDSRIAMFSLTGDMALRAGWGATPGFALSLGGFNPRFTPPPDFPALRRLAISLSSGDNPRLRLEAYTAVTSNTLQFGARLDLYAGIDLGIAGRLSIEGVLGFDALIQFVPFGFVIDIFAGVAFKHNGNTLFAISLELSISGPEPFHLVGAAKADLGILGKHSIPIDATIGPRRPPPELPVVDPLPDLLRALAEKGNWSAQLPASGDMLVTLRAGATEGEILVHPLGTVTVRQRLLPLGCDLARYGGGTLAGDRRFELSAWPDPTAAAGQPVVLEELAAEPVDDHFAPAQFLELSDDEKLSQPSFVLMQAGRRFTPGQVRAGSCHYRPFGYSERLFGADRERTELGDSEALPLSDATLMASATSGAVAYSPARSGGTERFAAPALTVKLHEPAYAVATTDTLASAASVDGATEPSKAAPTRQSYIAAREALARHVARHPADSGRLQIVAEHELLSR